MRARLRPVALAVCFLLTAACGSTSSSRAAETPRHGGKDRLVGIKLGRAAFDRANTPKYFVTIIDGAHSSDARGGDSPGQRALTGAVLGFLDQYVRDSASGLAALRDAAQTPGVTTLDAQP